MNYTRTNDALKVLINPKAALLNKNINIEPQQWPKILLINP